MASEPQLRQDGDTLHFSGVLDRAAVIALWPVACKLVGRIRMLDLHAVQGIDSAGLAMLAELQAPLTSAPAGAPAGLAELCAAYRLAPTLDFNASAASS